jgi:FkbM family methyltransferase
MTFVSYAQNYEDLILYRALRQVERGFYVDVGAADPSANSVTRAFYDRGWSGINVEPYGPFYKRLETERIRDINLQVVVAEQHGVAQLFTVGDSELSTVDPELAEQYRNEGRDVQLMSVPARTLTDICNTCGDIHFLKIDVEGSEQSVLAGTDLSRIRPWIILVEATEPGSPASTRQNWEELLTGRGYCFAYFDGLNAFYVAEERASLKERLAIPPNVFDDFIRNDELRLREALAEAEKQATDTSSRLANAEVQLAKTESQLAETRARLTAAEQSLLDTKETLHQAERRRATSEVALTNLRAEALELATERARAAERANQCERQLQAIHNSHSWRITAPIRAGSTLLRRNIVRRLGERTALLALSAPAALLKGKELTGETLTLGPDFGVWEADWSAWLGHAAKPSSGPEPAHAWLLVCGARSEHDLRSLSMGLGISQMRILGDAGENGATALQALVARAAPGDCIAVLRAGDRPGPALRRALDAFARSEADVGVFDGHFVEEGRAYPLLHPGFNPPYLAASDLAASRFLIRAGSAREALSGSVYGGAMVAFRAMLSRSRVWGVHIAEPAIRVAESRKSLADDRLRLIGLRPPAVVPEAFTVTVVICTHSKGHLLRQLLGHLERCQEVVELVLVGHNVTNPYALHTIRDAESDPRIRVIKIDGPFNFARIGNLAAHGAKGTHLLFLNDDIVPVSGDWLAQLLHPFMDEKVGATGALLLYPDESIQHAGMFLGYDRLAGHTLRAARLPDGDYMSMSAAPRAVSCLTGAALVVERRLFQDLNGFDPMLGTSLQDVDLCLRILRTGRMLIFNPRAVLLHLESTTLRPLLGNQEIERTRAHEQEYFRNRWLATVQTDPFHNPTFHAAGDESLHVLRPVPLDAS